MELFSGRDKKKISALSYAWGQALPLGKDIFLALTLMAFPRIRPDPTYFEESKLKICFGEELLYQK